MATAKNGEGAMTMTVDRNTRVTIGTVVAIITIGLTGLGILWTGQQAVRDQAASLASSVRHLTTTVEKIDNRLEKAVVDFHSTTNGLVDLRARMAAAETANGRLMQRVDSIESRMRDLERK